MPEDVPARTSSGDWGPLVGAAELAPLAAFYANSGLTPPAARALDGARVPEPYRRLLVNQDDLTPTLEAFHRQRLGLRVLRSTRNADIYARQVVLTGGQGLPVSFGAIRIHLESLPAPARAAVLAGGRPLGGILGEHAVAHTSRPSAYFVCEADAAIADALGCARPVRLYGRCNRLATLGGRTIAEVVEILPPVRDGAQP